MFYLGISYVYYFSLIVLYYLSSLLFFFNNGIKWCILYVGTNTHTLILVRVRIIRTLIVWMYWSLACESKFLFYEPKDEHESKYDPIFGPKIYTQISFYRKNKFKKKINKRHGKWWVWGHPLRDEWRCAFTTWFALNAYVDADNAGL